MAKWELREKALDMRGEGMSYSQIKEVLGVSKGTLSVWLREHPLPRERINELRGNSERRIERCRETKARKREERMRGVHENVRLEIGSMSDKEFFIGGLLLYWAEGTKAARGMVCMTNTDPAMLTFFIRWIKQQGVDQSRLKVKLHLYSDMNLEKETYFWQEVLKLPKEAFKNPYIKTSLYNKPRNYNGRFGHGTCNVFVHDIDLYERITAGIEYIRHIDMQSSVGKFEAV